MKNTLIILIISSLILFSACAAQTPVPLSSAASSPVIASSESETMSKQIYSDDLVTLFFEKKYEAPGLPGMFCLALKAENKSDKKFTVYLQDAYINESMVTMVSGIPLDVLPGKSGSNVFSGKYEGTGIKSADEIKKIGFKIQIMDESAATIETSENITIDF